MFNFYNKLPDFTPVGAGQNAVTKVPTGPTYREFVLHYAEDGTKANKATMIAGIEKVVIKINGRAVWDISGKHLVMLNDYRKVPFNDGELVIPLTFSDLRTIIGEENLCWGTRNVTNFFIEVKIASGATNPTLSGDAHIIPEARDLGIIREVHEYQYSSGVVGKNYIPDLPKQNGDLFGLHLENANITELEVKLGKTPYIEDDTDLVAYQNLLERTAGRATQTGYVHVDPIVLNRSSDAWALAGLQEFNVNPTLSSAGTIPIVMETLSLPLGVAQA